jgi:hypothetical protein
MIIIIKNKLLMMMMLTYPILVVPLHKPTAP